MFRQTSNSPNSWRSHSTDNPVFCCIVCMGVQNTDAPWRAFEQLASQYTRTKHRHTHASANWFMCRVSARGIMRSWCKYTHTNIYMKLQAKALKRILRNWYDAKHREPRMHATHICSYGYDATRNNSTATTQQWTNQLNAILATHHIQVRFSRKAPRKCNLRSNSPWATTTETWRRGASKCRPTWTWSTRPTPSSSPNWVSIQWIITNGCIHQSPICDLKDAEQNEHMKLRSFIKQTCSHVVMFYFCVHIEFDNPIASNDSAEPT